MHVVSPHFLTRKMRLSY